MLRTALQDNPVYDREKSFFRRGTVQRAKNIAYYIFLGLLSVLLLSVYVLNRHEVDLFFILGMSLSGAILSFQLIMLVFFLPPIASIPLLSEKNNLTLDILLTTTQSSRNIVRGKWLAIFRFNSGLVYTIAPLHTVSLLLFSIDIQRSNYTSWIDITVFVLIISLSQIFLLVHILTWSAVSIYLSTRFKTALQTSVFTYFLALAFIILPIIFYELFFFSNYFQPATIQGRVIIRAAEFFTGSLSAFHLIEEIGYQSYEVIDNQYLFQYPYQWRNLLSVLSRLIFSCAFFSLISLSAWQLTLRSVSQMRNE